MPAKRRSQGAPKYTEADCARIIDSSIRRARPRIAEAVRRHVAANNGQLIIHPVQILLNILPMILDHLPQDLREAIPPAIQANPRLLLQPHLAEPQEEDDVINLEDLPRIEEYNDEEELEQAIQRIIDYIEQYIQQEILRQLFNMFAQPPAPATAPLATDEEEGERPTKRQRITSTLKSMATPAALATGFIAAGYLAGCATGYPISGPILLLSGIGLKLRANIQNSCSQEAEQIEKNDKKRRRDSDGSPQGIR